MRFRCLLLIAVIALLQWGLVAGGASGDDYLTKDGQLTQRLKIVQLQGGFAGFTGMQYIIDPDGAWTAESVFKQKLTPKGKGKLSTKEVAKLATFLDKCGLDKLPEKSGVQPGANPHTVNLEYGTKKAGWVGRMRPKVDGDNPSGSVESRFAGLLEGVVGLLTPAGEKEKR
jgi:hypothetical protein